MVAGQKLPGGQTPEHWGLFCFVTSVESPMSPAEHRSGKSPTSVPGPGRKPYTVRPYKPDVHNVLGD